MKDLLEPIDYKEEDKTQNTQKKFRVEGRLPFQTEAFIRECLRREKAYS